MEKASNGISNLWLSGFFTFLASTHVSYNGVSSRRGGRVVECGGLENR